MTEVEFEENCEEIKGYLQTVRECRHHITQVPVVLKKLLDLLTTSTALLEDLCTFDDAPDNLQQQCIRSRQQMINFYEGNAFKALTDTIQDTVHQRLMRMEQIAQQSYLACKRRRDARAKYLSDTNGRLPFNFAVASPEKLQKHKREYSDGDESYRQACADFAQFRFEEMGTVQRDFYCGYSGVFALLANALNLPPDSRDSDALTVANARSSMREQQQRSCGLRPASSTLRLASRGAAGNAGESGGSNAAAVPASPPLASEESYNYQRQLSAAVSTEKPLPAAGGGLLCGTSSVRSDGVVDGIPVTDRDVYGSGTCKYTGSSPGAAAGLLEGGAAPQDTTAEGSSVPANGSSGNSDRRRSNEGVDDDAAAAAAATATPPARVRQSSSATLSNFDAFSTDAASFRIYSMLNSLDGHPRGLEGQEE
ncbi:hypothetical protein ABL78_7282 [Leptomonas seymouri]|uniref:Uncharacterized protein n=1 Tax=Leptomonas seymouri TaxID=5684 RepID=A0A0N1I271_LEPSE|nr:hypothetical protein ABL78_7282 [Leptomonas seymouri]|eukprot:KPI83672.1 hypothetical protein ABL78_7282 [Leptomonas seymouri]